MYKYIYILLLYVNYIRMRVTMSVEVNKFILYIFSEELYYVMYKLITSIKF